MATRTLRAVGLNEKLPKKPPVSVTDAVVAGSRREQMVAMRTRVARAIDEPNIRGADLAALTRRLLEISKEIEAIDVREHEDADEAAAPDDEWQAV